MTADTVTPAAPRDIDPARLAAFSASLVAQFGPRAHAIAEDQAAQSFDGVAAAWHAIARHIAAHAAIPAPLPDPPTATTC